MQKQETKILITGSSGFLGSRLKSDLSSRGMEVRGFDYSKNKDQDVRDFKKVEKAVSGVDGIVHTASISRPRTVFENPLEAVDINIRGFMHILEAVRSRKNKPWVIFISSREVFGDNPPRPVRENTPRDSKDLYVVCKIACEELCRVYSQTHGVKTRVLRFTNLYTGPKDYLDRVVPNTIISASAGVDINIHGTGKELFDFLYVDDAVRAIEKCASDFGRRKNVFYDDFNIATGKSITLPELAEIIKKKTGSKSRMVLHKKSGVSVSNFKGDFSKAENILRYNTEIDISKGIELAIDEFKNAKII